MDKIFYAYAVMDGNPDSGIEAFLNLPASPFEMLDALDKLRLGGEDTAQFGIEEYYHFDFLEPHLSEKHNLFALNTLAERLSVLDEQQSTAFAGLFQMETAKGKAPIPLSRIIDLAYSTDCCHVVDEALNDSQLGRFCAENGFVLGAENLPDEVFDLLDFERIGREHRQREGGVLVARTADHPGGYVERHSDLAEAYKTLVLTPKAPDYTILLEVSHDKNSVQLKLPASGEAIDATAGALNEPDWLDLSWDCLDCKVPALIETISFGGMDIESLNQFSKKLTELERKKAVAYKALLDVTGCKDFETSRQLMDTLGQYILSPEFSSPVEVAKGELSLVLCESDAATLAPHLNLHQYGESLIQRCGGRMTEYGLIERTDGQAIQAMETTPQQSGMEMR